MKLVSHLYGMPEVILIVRSYGYDERGNRSSHVL